MMSLIGSMTSRRNGKIKADHVNRSESALVRGGRSSKMQKVAGQPSRIGIVIAAPGHRYDEIVGLGMDVTVASVTCENNEDID